MEIKVYRILGEIGSYPDGLDGEKYEEIDVTIAAKEHDVLIIRDAIISGNDGGMHVFEKKTGKEVFWPGQEELLEETIKLIESGKIK